MDNWKYNIFHSVSFYDILIYLNKDIFDDKIVKISKLFLFLIPIFGFVFSLFVENVSVGIITTCMLIIIFYYIKYKKMNYMMIATTLTSMIGLILMLNILGTKSRINDMSSFPDLNLISKLLISFPRQMNYVFIKNSFLVLLLIFIADYYILNNFKGSKKYFFLFI